MGSVLVIDKELTPGTLMVFYSLISYVISPIGSLISSNQTIQDALIAADRLFQIMDLEREQDDSQKIELRKDMIGDIVFENVSFRYGSRKEVFNGLNLKIDKLQSSVRVGPVKLHSYHYFNIFIRFKVVRYVLVNMIFSK